VQIDPKKNTAIPSIVPPTPERTERSAGDAQKGAVDMTAFLPTAALTGLLTQLQGMPDVRDAAVAQARERLAKGDLLTPAAAAQTAGAILGAETLG
jgi:hypothetical protein